MNSKTLVYLTYGDVVSPVFKTQVIGFCRFLEQEMDIPTQLVSFVPLRLYLKQRKLIKALQPSAKVYPVINRWQGTAWCSKLNARIIASLKAASVMTRNPAAARVCVALQEQGMQYFYDARGCNYMEMQEYSQAPEAAIDEMRENEKLSIKRADWIYSVSEQLILHFKEQFLYRGHNHSIIPCCYLPATGMPKEGLREELFGSDAVTVFCYAGALSVWNFPRSFIEFCRTVMKQPNYRLIILSHQLDRLEGETFLQNERCVMRSVQQHEVAQYLEASDYGLLLRKKAVTNRVASPSKFADYLAAGCKVVISPELGDFSDFVDKHACGVSYRGRKDDKALIGLEATPPAERKRIKQLAQEHFLRNSPFNLVKYRNLKKLHDGF